MGTSADKLTYLAGTKTLLREAINKAGGALTLDSTFREYPSELRRHTSSFKLDFAKQEYVVKNSANMQVTKAGFSNILTFTRSSGGGRINSYGLYEWVTGSDTPRITYDSLTLECLGLMREDLSSNRLVQSKIFSGWGEANTTGVSTSSRYVEANVEVGISGSLDASRMYETSSGTASQRIYVSLGYAPVAGLYTYSVHMKKGTARYAGIRFSVSSTSSLVFDFDTETLVVGDTSSVSVVKMGNGWYRLSTTKSHATTDLIVPWVFIAGSDGNPLKIGNGQYVIIGDGQVEFFPVATSYIATSGSVVSRQPEYISIATVEPWVARDAGTYVLKATPKGVATTTEYMLHQGGSARLFYRTTGDDRSFRAYDGTSIRGRNISTIDPVMVATYNGTDFAVAGSNGVADDISGGQSFRDLTALTLFGTASGVIKSLEFYPFRMADAEILEVLGL